MKLTDLIKENIALIGLGSENYALLKFLATKKINSPITIFSFHSRKSMEITHPELKQWSHITWKISTPTIQQLKKFTIIIRSPGAFFSPTLRKQLKQQHIRVISPMQIFLDLCPTKNIIGVTGTKGKGTTSSLIHSILKQGKKKVWLGGNIGVAPFEFIFKIKKSNWVILELSSFQLEDMSSSPMIGVITNLSPEHLTPADKQNPNYHVSLSSYWQAKLNLLRFQDKNDIAIINTTLKQRPGISSLRSKKIFFTTSSLPSNLVGEHNKENIAAAVTVAKIIKIPERQIVTAIKNFKGLPYRLEKVTSKHSITYYNDSFATTPSATITALKSFHQPIILIAGGADKGSDFSKLAKEIKNRTKYLILFKGTALSKLQSALKKVAYNSKKMKIAKSMSEAITYAKTVAAKNDIILMSPACASFGLFKNYKDRGEQFTKLTKKI